jgi:glycerol-3-phosphate acyltransferase PlsX
MGIRIAIDAMGGDFGPEPIIEGLIQALDEKEFKATLVGNRDKILSFIPAYYLSQVDIHHCTDVISMDEAATDALKRKDSSIYQAIELVRNKKADAVVSAGHSGATMALSTLRIGRIKNVNKPPLATLMPNVNMEKSLLLDVGAVVECKPRNIYEFAIMGKAYAQEVMGIANPRIGLLSNGEEDSKGNELTKESFPLLKNIDGFVGMLKVEISLMGVLM